MAYTSKTPLIAGGGSAASAVNIGDLTLDLTDAGLLTVTYDSKAVTGDSRDDWSLDSIHFDFGNKRELIPTTKTGNPQVGLFDFGGKQASFVNTGEPSVVQFKVAGVSKSDLAFWAAHASVSQRDAITAFNDSLPDQVSMTFGYPYTGSTSYLKASIAGSSEAWLNGQNQEAWCVDTDHYIYQNTQYTAKVYSSLDESALSAQLLVDKAQNMNAVNWLLNNFKVGDSVDDRYAYADGTASCSAYTDGGPVDGSQVLTEKADPITGLGVISYGDIQRAIWALIEDLPSGISYNEGIADELADRAYFFGKNFVPDCDDRVAVVYAPYANGALGQVSIAQVGLISPQGSCEGRSETAWAITGGIAGLGGVNRFGSSWAEYNVL